MPQGDNTEKYPLEVFTGPQDSPDIGDAVPGELPILGLSDIVILPGLPSHLKIDSPEGIQLINDAVPRGGLLGLVFQKNVEATNPHPEDLRAIGCLARIQKLLLSTEEHMELDIKGLERIRIDEYIRREPYLIARVTVLPVPPAESPRIDKRIETVRRIYRRIIDLSDEMRKSTKMEVLNHQDPGLQSDLVTGYLEHIDLEDQQKVLETVPIEERLEVLIPLVRAEEEELRLQATIDQSVRDRVSKDQRKYILQKHLDAIKSELGEEDPLSEEVGDLSARIERNGLSREAADVCRKELSRLKSISSQLAEYQITRDYISFVVDLPWKSQDSLEDPEQLDLRKAEEILDRHHFGMERVKERVLDSLAALSFRLSQKREDGRNSSLSAVLCLVGPPGVGKTSLGKSIATILNRKFARISLGGMRDESEIRGHRRTYVGARPGRIIQHLARLKTNNPVIILDEIDKISTDSRGDPASALLEVLDPQQNHSFVDNYLDIPFDLSRVFFIATANWMDTIGSALRDRLEVIDLPSYTLEEKRAIAERHLIPRNRTKAGLDRFRIQIGPATTRQLVVDYTREAGVRELDRQIAAIMRKAARKFASRPGDTTIRITRDWMRKHLGPERHFHDSAEIIKECGISIGLGWTPEGGEILYIEALRIPGSGKFILTGSMGNVMKESAHTAYTFVKSQSEILSLSPEEFSRHDTHVHVPMGAIQKDGASAGVAIATALASLFTRQRIRSDLAMTGEVTLRGRVERVGGVREKILAAVRSGLKTVILPHQNRSDWEQVPEEARRSLDVRFVQEVAEVIRISLLP